MKRVIGPYVFEGGGAKSLNYQSLARDLGRATLEIPFNIPPYFALIARALGILEGSFFSLVCRMRTSRRIAVPMGAYVVSLAVLWARSTHETNMSTQR